MHASIPYNDEKPREFNMIELFGWSQVHSPFVNNANYGEINNLLIQSRDMDYKARHQEADLDPTASKAHDLFSPSGLALTAPT